MPGEKYGYTKDREVLCDLPQVWAVTSLRGAVTQPPRTVPSNRPLGKGVTEMMTTQEIDEMTFQHKLNKLRRGIVIPPPERMAPRKLTLEYVCDIAFSYDTRGEFRAGDKSAYNWASNLGLLDALCEHMAVAKRGPKSCAE